MSMSDKEKLDKVYEFVKARENHFNEELEEFFEEEVLKENELILHGVEYDECSIKANSYNAVRCFIEDLMKEEVNIENTNRIDVPKREEKQDKCKDCAGCTQWKCDCSNTRAKTIDDAMAALAKVICSDCGYLKGIECKYKGGNCSVSKPMLEKVISTLESLKVTQNS